MSLRENFCHLCNNMLITWFHEFWKYKSWIVHLLLFLSWDFLFCFGKKESYFYWHFLIYFDSQMKIHLEQIKTNSNSIESKSGFIDSGLVKTCDEHIISWENGYLFISSSARILIIFYTFLISLSDELWNKHETAAFSLLLHIYTKDHMYILRGPQKFVKSSIFSY